MSSKWAATLDTTDLIDNGSPFSEVAAVSPAGGQMFSGSTSSTLVEFFSGVTGPISFGPGIETLASSSSGDFVGLEGNGEGFLFTPVGFTSGALSETSTYRRNLRFARTHAGDLCLHLGPRGPCGFVHDRQLERKRDPRSFDLGDDAPWLCGPWLCGFQLQARSCRNGKSTPRGGKP
jgi:hypothetical protein